MELTAATNTIAARPKRDGWHRLACALLALSTSTAFASPAERRVSFGGFGTIGALYHNEDGLEYRRTTSQPRGAQAGEADFGIDSLAGVQINAAWNRELEAVAQGVTRLSADNDWQPQLTRAFIRYNPSETLVVRAGRIGWEIYPRADSRDIGYSHLRMRPAPEVFGYVPSDAFDGGEVALTRPLGDALLSFKLYGGAASGEVARQDGSVNDIDGSKLWGGHVDYIRDSWIVRLGTGVFQLNEAPTLDGLVAGLRATGQPQAQSLADRFSSGERRTLFIVGGAAYDEGPLQARLFAARTENDGVTGPNAWVGLVSAGYSLGDVTPYAMFSFIDSYDDVDGTGLPDTPQFAPLNAGAAAVQQSLQFNQHSLALGLRYDFLPKMALKLQVDRVRFRDSPLIFDRNTPPRDEADMTVVGVALDFIF